MQKIWLLILFFVTIASVNQAQQDVYDEVKNAEMSIPSAPAFAMLGVNPELVIIEAPEETGPLKKVIKLVLLVVFPFPKVMLEEPPRTAPVVPRLKSLRTLLSLET